MGSMRAIGSSNGRGGMNKKQYRESKAMVGSRAGSVSRNYSGSREKVSQWMLQGSALKMQEIEEAFTFFDANKDGNITETELAAALQRLGDKPTDEQVREMFREADTNEDGVISFEEFMALQSWVGVIHRQEGIFRQDVKQAFSRFDADGNGLISPEELQSALARLGRPCSLPDCCRMISRVDLDGDGHINFEEFLSMMKE